MLLIARWCVIAFGFIVVIIPEVMGTSTVSAPKLSQHNTAVDLTEDVENTSNGSSASAEEVDTDPCPRKNHQVIDISYSINNYNDTSVCEVWPSNTWVTFTNERFPTTILMLDASKKYCIQPSYCGSRYPWYIYTTLEAQDSHSSVMNLCTTDTTTTGTTSVGVAMCCRNPIPIKTVSCGLSTMYWLTKPIPKSLCGGICTTAESQCALGDQLEGKVITYHKDLVPKWLYELPRQIREHIITVTFQIEYTNKKKFKEIPTIDSLKKAIVSKWNRVFLWRRRRSSGYDDTIRITERNIHSIRGSPVTEKLYSYYSFYIMDDHQRVVPAQSVYSFIVREILNTDVSMNNIAHVSNVTMGPASEIKSLGTPPPTTTTTTTPTNKKLTIPPNAMSQTPAAPGSPWSHIFIIMSAILGFGAVVILLFLLLSRCSSPHSFKPQTIPIKDNSSITQIAVTWKGTFPYQYGYNKRPESVHRDTGQREKIANYSII